jgi:rhodanese-related sulfurtransferase
MLLPQTAPATRVTGITHVTRRHRRCGSRASVAFTVSASGLPFSPAHAREALLAKEALFVDVRSEREYRDEHLQGSVNLPLYLIPSTVPRGGIDTLLERPDLLERVPVNTQFEKLLKEKLEKNATKRVLFVCSNGKRSQYVANTLASEGYQAAFLVGGLNAWLPLYSPSGAPRKRVTAGVFKDTSGRAVWTDSAEEDTILPARGGNENDLPDEEPRQWGAAVVISDS